MRWTKDMIERARAADTEIEALARAERDRLSIEIGEMFAEMRGGRAAALNDENFEADTVSFIIEAA